MKQRTTKKKSGKVPDLSKSTTDEGTNAGKDIERPDAAAEARPAPRKAKVQKRPAPVDVATAAVATEGMERGKREKVVRDTFAMPKSGYDKIAVLKQRCLDAGVSVKKSELLRAGLLLLDSVPTKRLLAAVSALETVKTGRPAKSR
jgi:hypothetical protein